jgi:uncharacterized Rossmann fold enzyme
MAGRAPAFSRFVMIRPVQSTRPRIGEQCFCTGQGPQGRQQRSGHRPHSERTPGPWVYQATGNTDLYAARICDDVTIRDTDKNAIALSQLKEGQAVQLSWGANDWITAVTALKSINDTP